MYIVKCTYIVNLSEFECDFLRGYFITNTPLVSYLLHPPNFDNCKWTTDKRYIRSKVTS